MQRPFQVFQELTDIVVVQPRPQTQIPSLNGKRRRGSRGAAYIQRQAKEAIDDFLEGTPGFANFRAKFSRNIRIQS